MDDQLSYYTTTFDEGSRTAGRLLAKIKSGDSLAAAKTASYQALQFDCFQTPRSPDFIRRIAQVGPRYLVLVVRGNIVERFTTVDEVAG